MKSRTLVLVAGLIALGASPVYAQKKAPPSISARAHASAAQKAFKAERYDEAIAEYQAAYALTPVPGLLYNIARAYHRKGDKVQALEYYKRYLTDQPNGKASDEAREYVAALTREIQEAQPAPAPAPASPPPATPAPTPEPAPAPARPPDLAPAAAPPPEPAPAPAPPPPSSVLAGFGPKVGVTVSTVTPDVNSSAGAGFVVGGFAALSLADWLELQIELLFEQKHSDSIDNFGPVALNYLELPLLLKPTYRGFYVVLGPYVGVGVSSEPSFTDDSGNGSFNAFEFGLVAGIGYGIEAGPGRIVVDARYELGITAIRTAIPDSDDDSRNRTLSFTLGYAFH